MSQLSKAEQQRKLSQILSNKRKKDPIGLLRAQRNGTLNEYLREDLAKHGLAVAGEPAPAPTAASGGASRKPSTPATATTATTASPPTTANSPGQRQSYRAPSSTKPNTGATTGNTRGCLASLVAVAPPSHLPTPPPSSHTPTPPAAPSAAPSAASSSTGSETRAAPGKLSASRFNSFKNSAGTGQNSCQREASSPTPPPAESQEGAAVAVGASPTIFRVDGRKEKSDSPRRWTAGPVSSPSAQSLREQGEEEEEDARTETPPSGRNPFVESETAGTTAAAVARGEGGQEENEACAPSVGGLAERFGGVKLKSSRSVDCRFGSPSLSASASDPTPGVEKRSASGRIAELARRFEK